VLDTGRQCDLRVVEPLVHAVGDRTVVEQRREHLVHGVHDVRAATYVEQGFLLPGEGGLGQVFRGADDRTATEASTPPAHIARSP